MKKIILFVSLFICISAFGQNKEVLKNISDITFNGVDFSKAKVYSAKENTDEFKSAFVGINDLFITEAKKYNVSKAFNKRLLGVDVEGVKKRIRDIDANKSIDVVTPDYEIGQNDLQDVVSSLSIEDKEGTGLVFVAELLDKGNNRGYYHIVFFDIKTRDIIDTWRAEGKARGFGLRNFWAYSVLNAMNIVKIK